MDKERPDYLSYLLRLWRVENHGEAPDADKAIWRASLESAHTGERRVFANLDNLFEFLQNQTDTLPTCEENSSHTTRQKE